MYQIDNVNGKTLYVEAVTPNIFRIVYTGRESVGQASCLVEKRERQPVELTIREEGGQVIIASESLQAEIARETGSCCFRRLRDGKVLLQEGEKSLTEIDVMKYQVEGDAPVVRRVKTVDGERNFIENLVKITDRKAYRGRLGFCFRPEEGIYGLGQGEEGIYNYHGHSQYLYQHNMRIPMPCFVSDQGYGILADCCSLMTFESQGEDAHFFFDTIDQMDYYFVAGECLDEIIKGFRHLTGRAQMLPKWAYGYIQSKEAYLSQQELVDTVAEYRRRNVPIDGIVQDWQSWEEGNWGEKLLDKKRYPNMKEAAQRIHDMHAHTMVSVWPNMNQGGENYQELYEQGYMLLDLATYNAFDEKAREVYFQQAKRGLYDQGFDAWWCDSTEPFSGPDWNGEVKREPWERYLLVGEEHKKYLDPAWANVYALFHARGIYENQRKADGKKRVLNLTRSGYPSIQKYGAVLWSGDTSATWENFAIQMREGLNMAMSGYPYWTLDIGGFFTVHREWKNRGCGCNQDSSMKWFWRGDYEAGVGDLGYRELYTRWLQYGTFLPMFRSHGTDTPREIWQSGEKGEPFYDAIEKFINLRYTLMPYIYSLAAQVHFSDDTMMRSLLFDFSGDAIAKSVWDQFMLGRSLLVCPVTEPMYYGPGSVPLQKERMRRCYLPEGCDWYDFWTNKRYQGGQWVEMEAPIDWIPVFVRAGSILPLSEGIQYTGQMPEGGYQVRIYPGADAEFMLYEDDGDGYGFEQGEYAVTKLCWREEEQRFEAEKRQGSYPGMLASEQLQAIVVTEE